MYQLGAQPAANNGNLIRRLCLSAYLGISAKAKIKPSQYLYLAISKLGEALSAMAAAGNDS